MKNIYIRVRDFLYIKFPWLYIHLHLLKMWLQGADKYQRWLEKGDFYLYRGTRVSIGQPVKFRIGKKYKTRYIKELYYNFKKRKVFALYSNKPIKGYSEIWLNKSNKQ